MVQRTYGAMTNDVLISIPLFVLMGYVMERGALVDKMFYSIQLAFRRVPASLAVATLIVCTFWGIASGLVGAVVVLMGVIAFNPMLKAGYDVKLASGVITAGGTLGILIPPSVMIIVYAAVAGQSVVKLYAAAMFPGFFLSFLYLVYIIGWALINPKIAPRLAGGANEGAGAGLDGEVRRTPIRRNMLVGLVSALFSPVKARAIEADKRRITYLDAAQEFLRRAGAVCDGRRLALRPCGGTSSFTSRRPSKAAVPAVQQLGTPGLGTARGHACRTGADREFYLWFWVIAAVLALLQVRYYWNMNAERFEVVKLLSSSTMPLGILTVVVLGVILFGITTATESAAVGAAGAFLLAFHARTLDWKRTKEAVFLTAKTTAMVCWLFVGSALFSGGLRDPRRAGAARAMGAVAQHVARAVHDPVAGDHLRARLAARVDRDHHHLRADLPADAEALQHRPDPLGHAGVREPAGGVPVAAGRDVGVLSQGRVAAARHPQPDLRRHDALHADRHPVHDHHVSLARHDALAAELPLWRRLSGRSCTHHDARAAGAKQRKEPLTDTNLTDLTVTAAAARIARGETSSEELVGACLDRIAALEPQVQAWTFLDPERALEQARAADKLRKEGKGVGPLHGVPVGIKDIIDTADMPTENGCRAHKGRQPTADAACVTALRRAGAVIMGKTVTTELATFTPGKTHNPAQPGAHARRLLLRLGRRRRRRHGARSRSARRR